MAAGLTGNDPLSACPPIPLSIVTIVAFVVAQVSVEDWPGAIVVGLALNVIAGGGVTVTVAVAVLVPPVPVAVSVYVVVVCGATPTEPLVGPAPRPLSIVTLVAFVVVHVSVEVWPSAMLVGFALNVIVGAGGTVTVACFVAVPPAPVAVSV